MERDFILQCAENFGYGPRHFSLWQQLTYWRIPRPAWVRQNPQEPLATLFDNLPQLTRDGIVTWGIFIQTNSLLQQPGSGDAPAELVYSLEDTDRVELSDLAYIVRDLAQLKRTTPVDKELAWISNYLIDGNIRVFGRVVPRTICPRYRCRISTTYVVRKHLPSGYVRNGVVPIIVNPVEPYVALVLPDRYWPEPLIKWWSGIPQ